MTSATVDPDDMGSRDLGHAIAGLFETDVRVGVATAAMSLSPLRPEEALAVASAAPGRRADFAAGRACAHAALARLGAPSVALVRLADGAPSWPVGYVGSISHCPGVCAAVVARSRDAASLGFDVEQATPLEEGLSQWVCRPSELSSAEALGHLPGANWAKVVFSAKEAFYKCYRPIGGEFLEFKDVVLRLGRDRGCNSGRFAVEFVEAHRPLADRQDEFRGRWTLIGAHVLAGVTLGGRPDS